MPIQGEIVVAKMCKEQSELGGLSPRDMFLLLRDNDISPSLEELLAVFSKLSTPEIGILQIVNENAALENAAYTLSDGRSTVSRLRAIAGAIESGLSE